MEVKAIDVKALREKTGAGLLDCKKALVEAEGDAAKAELLLKELGLAAAAKRSGRATNEGRVFSLVGQKAAALVELSCETDFVARNQDFIGMGEALATAIVENQLSESTPELEEIVKSGMSKIKENITLKRLDLVKIGENQLVVDYIHGDGKIGVLVVLQAGKSASLQNQVVKDFAFDCALHVAAFNPLFLSRDSVDPKYMAEQESIFKKQTEGMDKPEKVLIGIAKGKLNKHLGEIVFLEQGFVKEEKRKVSEVLKDVAKESDDEIALTGFRYYRVGDEA